MIWHNAKVDPPEYDVTVWLFAAYSVTNSVSGEKYEHKHFYLGQRIGFGCKDDYNAVRIHDLKSERLRKDDVLYWAEYTEPVMSLFTDDIVPDRNEYVPHEQASTVKSRLIASAPFRSGVIDID